MNEQQTPSRKWEEAEGEEASAPAAAATSPTPVPAIELPGIPEDEPPSPARDVRSVANPPMEASAPTASSGSSATLDAERPLPRSARAPDRADGRGMKIGIIGGSNTGKSYLFYSMVYRVMDGKRAGVLAHFLSKDTPQISEKNVQGTWNYPRQADEFVKEYMGWQRLGSTTVGDQRWLKLILRYRTGLWGWGRSAMEVTFFDAAGEGLQAAELEDDPSNYQEAFGEAEVMVFCLPIWVAFPAADGVMTAADWSARQTRLADFAKVLTRYNSLLARSERRRPPRVVLALTMGDDPRCALADFQSRWITPYVKGRQAKHLRQLRSQRGLQRYLHVARVVSEALTDELGNSEDPRVSSIPERLDFGAGPPWVVAVSAIAGDTLDQLNPVIGGTPQEIPDSARDVAGLPSPVHVELPLLIALCAHNNALL